MVGLKSYCTVVEIRRDCMCRPLGLFLTHKQCAVETGQMSSAETGQMCAVETGQMSAAETGQMSSVERTDVCFVPYTMFKSQNSQLSQYHTTQILEISIVPTSQCSSLR